MTPMTQTQWIAEAKRDIDTILANNGKRPHKHKNSTRFIGRYLCLPCCCVPCILWSSLWRLICMPCSCMAGYGPVSNNPCTDITDTAISTCWTQFNVYKRVPNPTENAGFSKTAAMDVLLYAHSAMETVTRASTRYAIADYVFPVYKAECQRQNIPLQGKSLISVTPHEISLFVEGIPWPL